MNAPLFWSRVTLDGEHWIYAASVNNKGYGVFHDAGQSVLAHRFAYEDKTGPIPAGLEVDHLCRVTTCVRPSHLEPVTHAENMRRAGAAKTHCVHGHEYTPENTRINGGARTCIACKRAYDKRLYARKKATA